MLIQALDPRCHLLRRLDEVAGDALTDDLRSGAAAEGDHRRAAGHRLDHDEAEGLVPEQGHEQDAGVGEELALRERVCLAGILDAAGAKSRPDAVLEVLVLLGERDLAGEDDAEPGALGCLDRQMGRLIAR